MPRFRFQAEVVCGLEVLIDAPDLIAARSGAAMAMVAHVAESCGGVTVEPVGRLSHPTEVLYTYGETSDLLTSSRLNSPTR